MMIRPLMRAELSKVHPLLKMFAEEVKLAGGYSPERFEELWAPMMELGFAEIFVAGDSSGVGGVLGATYVPDLFSAVQAAQSQFWFVDPQHRHGSASARLFSAFENEAKRRGAQKYFVGHKIGVHEEAMKEFFVRHGYRLGENIYWKNLCP